MAVKFILALLLLIAFTISLSRNVLAEVFINEFSYQTGNDWVELYNSTCDTVNLEGWKIKDSTESQSKSLSGQLNSKGVLAFDMTFLNNTTSDKIRLFQSQDQLTPVFEIDIPIGSLTTSSDSQSVGREIDGQDTWKVFEINTKNNLNSSSVETCPSPTPTVTPSNSQPTLAESENSLQANSVGLIINEAMPFPDQGDEWVEIYNPSNQTANLNNYSIDDIDGGSKSVVLPDSALNPGEYFVYFTGSVFNNTGDSIRLLFDNQVISSQVYTNAKRGVALALDQQGTWLETTDPTPGEANSISALPITPTSTPTPEPTKKPTPTSKPSPTPKVTKIPTPKVLGSKTAASASASNITSQTKEDKINYLPFYLASSLITASFLGHTVYTSNRKKINRKIKKSWFFKKLKSLRKII